MRKGFFFGEKGTDGEGRRARDNESGIAFFDYRYDGTIGGDSFRYGLSKKDGAVIFKYESMMYGDSGKIETEADEEVLEKLYAAYIEYRLAEWNGYSKYNTMVCDGNGFSLDIRFNDGATLFSSGMNAFPPRYAEFITVMRELLDPLRDKALHEAGVQ